MSDLPKGWVKTSLFDISKPKQWKTIPTKDLLEEGYPLYGANGIIGKYSEYSHEESTLMITCRGASCGNVHISVPKSYINGNAMTLDNLSKNINIKFLYYFLKSYNFERIISGTAQPQITQEGLHKLEVLVAPLNEQIRIADKLDSILAKVDQAQARLEKIPGILKRFRQAVLAAATSGELTREWRESRSNNINHDFLAYAIEEYDSKPLPELPPDWIFIPFEHAADIKSNLVDPKLTPDAIHLAPNHIEQNTGKILEIATVAEDGVASSKHKFFSGQIIYSKIRPYLNKVCLVDFDGVCSADMYPIKAKSNTKYLLYFMLSEMFVHWTSQQQGRVVLPKINQKSLNKIPVAFPPADEQLEIVRRVDELLSRANTIEKNFVAAKGWFDRVHQSVLAKAFRGELVPQDSNDESASELLERIKSVGIASKAKKKPEAKPKAASIKEVIIDDQRIRDEVHQLESFATDLDAGNHDLSDSLRASYQAEIQKAQELLVDAKFTVEQFRSITDFKGRYDELKALIMNLLKGIPNVSEPLLAIESWDEKSGDYLMRLVKQK